MTHAHNQLASRLATIVRTLHRIEDGVLAIMLLTMIVLATTQIFLRNVFDTGLTWADPLLRIMLLWLGLLGALAASRDNKHITIDILTRLLNNTGRNLVHLFTSLFTVSVCGIIAWHAGRFVRMEYAARTLAVGEIPIWIFELVIPVAFALIALRYLLQFVQHALALRRPGETA